MHLGLLASQTYEDSLVLSAPGGKRLIWIYA